MEKKLAADIYKTIGGKENIVTSENCMTRIRLVLKEKNNEMLSQLKKLNGVLGINNKSDELQIILGPGVSSKVADELKNIIVHDSIPSPNNLSSMANEAKIGDGKELHEQIRAKNATPFKLLLKKIASIFIPMIPGWIACGLITGIINILLKFNPAMADLEWIKMLGVMGSAIYFGLNIFVGIQSSKTFGGSPIIGCILAGVISGPGLANIQLYGENLVPGRGGIIAVLMVTALAAVLEKRLHKVIPGMVDLLITPLVTVVVSGFASIFILQPIGGVIANALGDGSMALINAGGAVAGFVLGGIWLPVVMMGIHQAMTPIHAQLFESLGINILLPILAMAGGSQVGAAFAVYFKTKNKFLKKTIATALPIGLMGVGEPLIYGVTLPLFKPFIGACIGGAFGGAVQAMFVVGSYGMGVSGLPLAALTNNIPVYLMGLVTAYIAGFIATWFIGFDDPPEE